MKKCRVQKNACKICLQSVTKRTGLQCEGACKKWVHYDCLDFTPGKVRDIKKGYIKVMCPCPDCTTEPKEILVNPPFTCKNQRCPANSAPKCTSPSCPINNPNPCQKNTCPKNSDLNDKPYTVPNEVRRPPPGSPPDACLPQYGNYRKTNSDSCCCPQGGGGANCPAGTDSSVSKMQSASASDSQLMGRGGDSARGSASNVNQQAMVTALEQMCSTVGELSVQIRELMIRILDKTKY